MSKRKKTRPERDKPKLPSRRWSFFDEAHAAVKVSALSADDVSKFLARAEHVGYDTATIFMKRLLQMAIVTVVTAAIALNAIRDGNIAGFSVTDLKIVIIAAPILLAVLYHDAMTSLSCSNIAADIAQACYVRLYGDAYDQLVNLLPPATFIDLEVRVLPRQRGLAGWFLLQTSRIIRWGITLGPVALVLYACLLLQRFELGLPVLLSVLVLTGVILIRSVLLAGVTIVVPQWSWKGLERTDDRSSPEMAS